MELSHLPKSHEEIALPMSYSDLRPTFLNGHSIKMNVYDWVFFIVWVFCGGSFAFAIIMATTETSHTEQFYIKELDLSPELVKWIEKDVEELNLMMGRDKTTMLESLYWIHHSYKLSFKNGFIASYAEMREDDEEE